MKAKIQEATKVSEVSRSRTIKIFGVGGAGVQLLDTVMGDEFTGASFAVIDTDATSLAASSAPVKIQLETKLMRGMGTGGDPERGRALAEEQFSTLKTACEGATVIFILAGLGGGAGSGISSVIAHAAKETGALVLAFVTLPFACEGNRRQQQAQEGLGELKAVADGVICLPNQKTFKMIDENTSVLDTFRITGGLLLESVRGVWRLLTRPRFDSDSFRRFVRAGARPPFRKRFCIHRSRWGRGVRARWWKNCSRIRCWTKAALWPNPTRCW